MRAPERLTPAPGAGARGGAMRIRSVLRLTILGVSLAVALAVGGASTYSAYRAGLDQVTSHLMSVAAIKEADVTDWTQSLSEGLDAAFVLDSSHGMVRALLAMDPHAPDFARLRGECGGHMAHAVSVLSAFEMIALARPDFTIVSSSSPELTLTPAQKAALLQASAVREAALLPAPATRQGFKAAVVRPVHGEGGRLLGYILGMYAAPKTDQLMSDRSGLGETGQIYLVGRDGVLLTRLATVENVPGRTRIESRHAREAIASGIGGQGKYQGPAGRMVIGAWRPIPSLDAVLVAEQDISEAMRPIYAMAAANLAIAFLGVLAAFAAATLLSGRMTEPISQLAGTARELAEGNLDARAAVPGHGPLEAQELAEAFNATAQSLASRIEAERLLSRIARDLIAADDPLDPRALQNALAALAGHCKAASAAIVLSATGNDKGIEVSWPEEPHGLSAMAFGLVASCRLDETDLEPKVFCARDEPSLFPAGRGTVVLVPVLTGGKACGALCAASEDEVAWGETQARLLMLAGEIIGMAIQRARAEAARMEAERRYRSLFDNAADGIAQTTADGRTLLANPAAARMFGYASVADMIGHATDFGRQHWADPADRRQLWENLAEKGHFNEYEAHFVRTDGSDFWASLDCNAVMGPGGAPARLDVIIKDITAKRALEQERARTMEDMAAKNQELDRAHAMLTDVLDSMPSFLAAVTPEGTIAQLNTVASLNAGETRQKLIGLPFEQVFPHLAGCLADARQAIRTRVTVVRRRQPGTGPATGRFLDVTAYPLAGGSAGAVLRLDDVTERVNMEEVMVQSEKMLSVGGLAAGMAHEINNPLAGILQCAQNVRRRLSPDLKINQETARRVSCDLENVLGYLKARGILDFVDQIKDAGERAAKIVANMLEFSRRGDSTLRPRDLTALIDQTLELAASDYDLSKRFDFKAVNIQRDYGLNLPYVPCSASQIQQVLLNLIRNAAHALHLAQTPEPRIAIRARLETGFIRIEVEDNGPGIPEDVRKRIFEPFFTTKGVGQGTGLGLSVSYFIITQTHRGAITADPAPGGGTLFTIRLPLAQKNGA
jgi:PAS domain S-box-containing protein